MDESELKKVFNSHSVNDEAKAKTHSFKVEKSFPSSRLLKEMGEDKKRERKMKKSAHPIAKGRATFVALDGLHCSLSQKYPVFLLEQLAALQGRQIKAVQDKQRFIASRALKNIINQIQLRMPPLPNRVKTWDKKKKSEMTEAWIELLTRQEERQFQITRIINYLRK